MQAKIWQHSAWITTTQPSDLRHLFDTMLSLCGFNVLEVVELHFQPQGYTCLWLLAESHFAVHTFPEHGRTYIELASCNGAKYRHFLMLLSRFNPQPDKGSKEHSLMAHCRLLSIRWHCLLASMCAPALKALRKLLGITTNKQSSKYER